MIKQGMCCSLNRIYDTVLTNSEQLLPRKSLLLGSKDSVAVDGNTAGLTKCISVNIFPSITFLLSVIKYAK